MFFNIAKITTPSIIGNTIALKIPIFKLASKPCATVPTKVGPREHPKSPASASNANIAVPPVGKETDAKLNVPGHIIPTEKPQTAQPSNPKIGYGEIDATIAATHLMLAATAIGLGSCYVCSFKEAMVREILDIPSEYEISCLLPVGYPKEIVPHNSRKDIEELVIYK